MSRNINLDRPLSDEEKEYLKTRSDGPLLVQMNEDRFESTDADKLAKDDAENDQKEKEYQDQFEPEAPADGDEDVEPYDDDVIAKVAPLTVAELKEALTKRGVKFKSDLNKEDLQEIYLEILQKEKDESTTINTRTESDPANA